MHEVSIVQSLRESILEHLPEEAVLERVHVEVGSLEHLDHAVMQLAWEGAATEPPLKGAVLTIDAVDLLVRCRNCSEEYVPENAAYLVCPGCGNARPEILRGWGVTLKTLEAVRKRDRPAKLETTI